MHSPDANPIKILLWTPESDHDADAIEVIGKKIIGPAQQSCVVFNKSTKQAYQTAIRASSAQQDGLIQAVRTYLKAHNRIIFLIDFDCSQEFERRKNEPNSYFNRISRVLQVPDFRDRVSLIVIKGELEAWLLVDVLGICCYVAETDRSVRMNPDTRISPIRSDVGWQDFAKSHQPGRTDTLIEALPGGDGAKEFLEKLVREIAQHKNPKARRSNSELKYKESLAPDLARFLWLDPPTMSRNGSLHDFALRLSA